VSEWHPIEVRSYAGYRGEESPRFFRVGEIEFQVSRVLRQTTEQTIDRHGLRRFQVLTMEGQEYTLIQEVESGSWFVEIKV